MTVNRMNSILAWLSIFAFAWLLLLDRIELNLLTSSLLSFFIVIALFSAALDQERPKK